MWFGGAPGHDCAKSQDEPPDYRAQSPQRAELMEPALIRRGGWSPNVWEIPPPFFAPPAAAALWSASEPGRARCSTALASARQALQGGIG